jgi:hypothetical protein
MSTNTYEQLGNRIAVQDALVSDVHRNRRT